VYGVRDVHRSHRIDVPRPAANTRAGRTDACTLCHLERDAGWAERELARRPSETDDAGRSRAERGSDVTSADDGAVMLEAGVGGDPVQRAVIVDAIATAPGGDRAGRLGVLLSTMHDDAYPAIRHLAWRSVRTMARVPLAPSLFVATDGATMRAAAITRIREQLGEPIADPDPEQISALRARARDVAIEIGE
ncbi:MAG: hypothetical protein M3Y87_36605, partial [Myxococcota bacterium]|nr:hypothetical protein [Myxococcota bacterium]